MQSDLAVPASSSPQPSRSPDFVPDGHTKKKKKKRSRDDVDIDASLSGAPKEKKKKGKHHDVSPTDQGAAGAEDSSKKEKKKKKQDKGKSKDTSSVPAENSSVSELQAPTEPLDEEAQASAAALLSAILALAAAGAPDMMNVPPPPLIDSNYPPPIAPGLLPHFVPIGAEHSLPYVPNSHMQSIPDPAVIANMGLPITDLSSGSNEDVLRALQDLDITKIAGVLKTLGEAAVAANVPPLPTFPPAPLFYPPMIPPPQQPPPINGYPAPSNAILGIPPKMPPPIRMVPPISSVPEQHGNPEHAILLSTRWLGAAKLAELVRTEGLVYKKGKFSATEEQLIHDAINNFTSRRGMTEEELQEIIFPPKGSEKAETIEFWQLITAAVPLRPIIAVYHHVRRTYHPLKQQGRWSEEEDARLKKAVAELGQSWEKVSRRVGRMSSDCRDRYRNHIQNREVRRSGPWLREEEELLTRIVTDMTIRQGKDIDNDVFWGKVSELMGGRRGRQQCRIKWTDSLSKIVKNSGEMTRWSQQDAFILVHKVDSLNVHDDTEIDWKTLSDPDWNLWSAHTLQRRWLTMKRSIKGYENMTHAEVMDILRVKKAHLPTPPAPPPPATTTITTLTPTITPAPTTLTTTARKRRVTSAAAISDADSLNSSADATRAGSENSPVNEDTDSSGEHSDKYGDGDLSSDDSSSNENSESE